MAAVTCVVDKIKSYCVRKNEFAIFTDGIVLCSDVVHVYVCCMCCVLDFGYSSESLYTIVPPGQVSRVSLSGTLMLLTLEFSKFVNANRMLCRVCKRSFLGFLWGSPLVL